MSIENLQALEADYDNIYFGKSDKDFDKVELQNLIASLVSLKASIDGLDEKIDELDEKLDEKIDELDDKIDGFHP